MSAMTSDLISAYYTKPQQQSTLFVVIIAILIFAIAFLNGCSYLPSIPPSNGHLSTNPESAETIIAQEKKIPEIITDITSPAISNEPVVPVYSVDVHEVPVKELLRCLSRDAKINIDIHPHLQGVVSLNAVDETLPNILDRVSQQVSLRYVWQGKTLIVMPDTPYLKTYRVDYVNITRNTTSSIGVSGQIADGAAVHTASVSGGGSNSSNTNVNSTSNNNFWETLTANIKSILTATRAQSLSAEEKAARMESQRSKQEARIAEAQAVAHAGNNALALFNSVFGHDHNTSAPGEIKDEVVVNPITGSIGVVATEYQHQLIQHYLDTVTTSAQRQVMIEATIVEVRLSDDFKAGVDWNRVLNTGGFSFRQSLLAGNLSAQPNFVVGYSNNSGSLNTTVKLLEQFGNTRVLSSPKLMAINNQTALLKVVDNIVYFSIDVQQGTTSSTGVITTPTYSSTAHTVPIGVVMSVTPQINDIGNVALIVRPTVTRILGYKNDPNPALLSGTTPIINPVPEIQVREMESVLQANSGQIVVLGGLMQDDIVRRRDTFPGLGNTPGLNDLFSYRDEAVHKTELVVFLRPTVITSNNVRTSLVQPQSLLPNNFRSPFAGEVLSAEGKK